MMVQIGQEGTIMDKQDMFTIKQVRPMQMTTIPDAFDAKEYSFALMQDGIRCIAFLDENSTELRSARNMRLLPLFPELSSLHYAAMRRCVIDGFIVSNENELPPMDDIHNRMRITLPYEIQKAARERPAKLVAYDLLYWDDEALTGHRYDRRRMLLLDALNDRPDIEMSHAMDTLGIALYGLAAQNGWDGILAKRKDGLYRAGKHPKDWLYIPVHH